MADRTSSSSHEGAQQVFRQFAWNLAGTLVRSGSKSGGKSGGRSGSATRRPTRRAAVKRGAAK